MNNARYVYDLVPYKGVAIPNTSPNHLAICSAWHGGPLAPLQNFRYLELGCGEGGNLIPLAYYHPESEFIGIDLSSRGIACAIDRVTQLGLNNVMFIHKDICSLRPEDLLPCDYVVAHGLFSWVSEEVRDAILTFCSCTLSSRGLAYISYNAMPGWSIRRLVRESLLRAKVVQTADIEDKGRRAIEYATQLLENLPSREYAHSFLLADELERVRNAKPSYVYHEYFGEHNEGFWLQDFTDFAARKGLDYVSDAQFCRWEGYVPPELNQRLSKRNLNTIEQEEVADLLGDRSFRASVLSRVDADRTKITRHEFLEDVYLSSALQAQSGCIDLTEGIVERFYGCGGTEIVLDGAITKAAVTLLSAQWPRGILMDELYIRAKEFLARHKLEVSSLAHTQLTEEIVTLFEAGQIELRFREPAHSSLVAACPSVHALACLEAQIGEMFTTPFHLPLTLEKQALPLAQINGRQTVDELIVEFGQESTEQTLAMLNRWGLLA